jgi:hypothetical protein
MPAGGLAVLGAGTAGATTVGLVSVSNVKVASLFTLTMVGRTLFNTTAVGTQRIAITTTFTQGGGITARLTGTLSVTVATTGGTKSIQKLKIRDHASLLITGPTSEGLKGCDIVDLPPVGYSSTSALKWSATTISLSGVSITGPTSCTGRTALADAISGHKINSTLTFSAA